MKANSIIFLLILSVLYVKGQNGSVRGVIIDSVNKEVLPFTSIVVYKQDSILINYALSDKKGAFLIRGLPLDQELKITCSHVGFRLHRARFTLVSNNRNPDIGEISLLPVSDSLDEVVILAEIPPVVYKNGQLEFNANAFKTFPNSVLEDLLKKLPGVHVDANGNVTVNSRKINRILIDGKLFFGDDLRVATKNIPSNLVEKVQVTTDKDELESSGIDNLNSVGSIINVKLKKTVKRKRFGRAYVGAGIPSKFEVGGIMNFFRDTFQINVVAFSNNVNRSGFSIKDLQSLGSFSESGFNTIVNSTKGGMNATMNQGEDFEQGVSTSSGIGVNLNFTPNTKKSTYLQLYTGMKENRVSSLSTSRQSLGTDYFNTNINSNSKKRQSYYNLQLGRETRPNQFHSSRTRLLIAFLGGVQDSRNNIVSSKNINDTINKGQGSNLVNEQNLNIEFSNSTNKKFRSNARRLLTSSTIVKFSTIGTDRVNEFLTTFLIPTERSESFERKQVEGTPNLFLTSHIIFTEPLSKHFLLKISPRIEVSSVQQSLETFAKDSINGLYSLLLTGNTSEVKRVVKRGSVTPGLVYNVSRFTFSMTSKFEILKINDFANRNSLPEQTYLNILPAVSLIFRELNINYSREINPPTIDFLSPVPQISNPFSFRYGSDSLLPQKRSSISVGFFSPPLKRWGFLSLTSSFVTINSDVVFARTIDQQGSQSSKPINVNGTRIFTTNINYGVDIRKDSRSRVIFRLGINYSTINREVRVNNIAGAEMIENLNPVLSLGFEVSERLDILITHKIILGRNNFTKNIQFSGNTSRSDITSIDFKCALPSKFFIECNTTNRIVRIRLDDDPRKWAIVNCSIYRLIAKGSLQLKLSVFDLLGKNQSFNQFVGQNFFAENRSTALTRFVLLSVVKNFGSNFK